MCERLQNLFLVDRIDCEDEAETETPLEKLAPELIRMNNLGYAMPTLLIRCAGKNADGVINSSSSMQAIANLKQRGAPIGIHVHTRVDKQGQKIPAHYFDRTEMLIQFEDAVARFIKAFNISPAIFGMGDLACSSEEVAELPKNFGLQMNLGDIIAPKFEEGFYDYRTDKWKTDFPIFKHNLWWIPLGTDGIEGSQGYGWLGIWAGQNRNIFNHIFKRYKELGTQNPERNIIVSSIVHPPEALFKWDIWVKMHEIAKEHSFKNITSVEALEMLKN